MNTDRISAQLAGAVKYTGAPCARCSCTTRWTRNRTCVQCGTRHQSSPDDSQARASAKERGASIYTSPDACRCGDRIRYVCTGCCLACARGSKRMAA